MGSSAVSLGRLFERGVWRAPYLVRGCPALIAVDAFGVARKHVVLHPGSDVVRESDALADALDLMDPPNAPRLTLVRSVAVAVPKSRGAVPVLSLALIERAAASADAWDPYGT